jgi:hypothetical protein
MTIYERARAVVRDMDATMQGESTKEEYLKRIFDDVTRTVVAETLKAVEDECERKRNNSSASPAGHGRWFALRELSMWCVSQRSTPATSREAERTKQGPATTAASAAP